MTHETIPVELAFISVILAFVAGYSFRAVISKVRRAMAGRDRHIDWDIASESFSHIPTASSAFRRRLTDPVLENRPNRRLRRLAQLPPRLAITGGLAHSVTRAVPDFS